MFRLKTLVLLAVSAITLANQASAAQILWLDASDNSKVTTSGGFVTGWQNKAPGFSNTLSSASPQQPTLVAGPNGTQAIHFDGGDAINGDTLRDVSFNQTAPELTMFLVVAPNSNGGSYKGFFSATSTGGSDYANGLSIDMKDAGTAAFSVVNFEGPKATQGGGYDFYSGSVPFGGYHILQVNYWNTNANLVFDGTPDGGVATGNQGVDLTQIRVGSRYYGGSEQGATYLDGNIAEVLAYNTQLTSQQANAIGFSLETKYGLNTAYVPEPSSIISMIVGCVALVPLARRLRRRA